MGGVFTADVIAASDDGMTITLKARYPLVSWTYPLNSQRNPVPVLVRNITVGMTLSVQAYPNVYPSQWVTEHIAHCKICAAIVHERGANALPKVEPYDTPVNASLASESAAPSAWQRFVAGGGLFGVLLRLAIRLSMKGGR